MIQRILGAQFARVASAALLIGGFSVLSKMLGLYRNRIFTSEFGAGSTLDVYYAAFLIPDFIYNIFVLGLLSAVFIPIFSEYLHKDEKEAWHFANVSLNIIIIVIGVFAAAMYFLMPYILPLVIAGFSDSMKSEAVSVARLMLLSPIFLAVSSIFGSIIQNFKKYVFYALAPVFYNIGIIFGALVFGPVWGAYGLAVGVALGAFLHFLIQIAGAFSVGFDYRLVVDFWHIGFLKMGKLSIARFFSLAASQLNFIILTSIASFLAVGSIAIFNLANDLQFIPIGVIALSYAVAVFPKFSDAVAKNDKDSFSEELFLSLKQVLFFILPISALLIFASFEVVVILYGVDTYGIGSSRLVAAALVFFSFSIFAQSLSPILIRAFYAMQNTVIPFFANIISIISMITLIFVFISQINEKGIFFNIISSVLNLSEIPFYMIIILALPMAFSAGAVLNFIVLFFMLKKLSPDLDFSKIKKEILKMIFAFLIMAVAVYFILKLDFSKDGVYFNAFWGFISAAFIGGAIYILALWILKSEELIFFKDIVFALFKKSERQKAKAELPESIDNP